MRKDALWWATEHEWADRWEDYADEDPDPFAVLASAGVIVARPMRIAPYIPEAERMGMRQHPQSANVPALHERAMKHLPLFGERP